MEGVAAPLAPGRRVRIDGILSRPELNGTYGKISDQNESGRFNVQLEMEVKSGQGTTFILSNRFVAVRPQNLAYSPRMPRDVANAATHGHVAVVAGWLDAEAAGAIEARHPLDGGTLLQRAACCGHLELTKELLRRGAQVDVQCIMQGQTSCTALMFAAASGQLEIAKLLLEAGARTDLEMAGMNALALASSSGHHNVAALLRGHGSPQICTADWIEEREREPASAQIPWKGDSCAQCGLLQEPDQRFKCCPVCTEMRLAVPARFCSDVCFKLAWKGHKRWHKRRGERGPSDPKVKECSSLFSKLSEDTSAGPRSPVEREYAALLAKATQALQEQDAKTFKKYVKRAITLHPTCPTAHFLMADILQQSDDFAGAVPCYTKVMDLIGGPGQKSAFSGSTLMMRNWGRAAAEIAYCTMAGDLPLASWMTDANSNIAFATKVVDADPDYAHAHVMLANAHVCDPGRPSWRVPSPTIEQIRSCVKSYERAVELEPAASHRRPIFAQHAVMAKAQLRAAIGKEVAAAKASPPTIELSGELDPFQLASMINGDADPAALLQAAPALFAALNLGFDTSSAKPAD